MRYKLGPGWPPAYVEVAGVQYPWREYNQPDREEWTGSYDLIGDGVQFTRQTESGIWARIYASGAGQTWYWTILRGESDHQCGTARSLADAITAADKAIAEMTATTSV